MPIANSLAAYTAAILQHAGRYLLLQRAGTKPFAPNRWTGIGGRVEPGELNDLRAAALRELREETGIVEADLTSFGLRRVLVHNRPGEPVTALLFFTGVLVDYQLPECTEGVLRWVRLDEMAGLDVIETAAAALPLLVEDMRRDPAGLEPPRLGVADYQAGALVRVLWTGP